MNEQLAAVVTEHWDNLKNGVKELLKAYEYAAGTQVSVWEFAISDLELGQRGLTFTDLRCLIAAGFADCRREITRDGDGHRVFIDESSQQLLPLGCFVLTRHGFETLKKISISDSQPNGHVINQKTPVWDAVRHELWFDERLVKRFRLPSPNQERVVAAFHEEDWPPRIDDPLPPVLEQDPKQRLHDTIRSLNRHHTNQLLRFSGDGTGEGVRWDQDNDAVSSERPSSNNM